MERNLNGVDVFLLMSAVAYYWAAILSLKKPTMRNRSPAAERTSMLALGSLLMLNLAVNLRILWLLMGVLWTLLTCLTYLGYVEWNVLWRRDASDVAQVGMCFWDMAIAVLCLMEI